MSEPAPTSVLADAQTGFDALPAGLVQIDAGGRVSLANEGFRALFGSAEPPHGRDLSRYLIHNGVANADELSAWLRPSPHPRAARALDVRLNDGRTLHVEDAPTQDGGACQIWRDVTEERRRAARQACAVEAAADGVAHFDASGRLELWDAEFALTIAGGDGLGRGDRLGSLLSAARCAGRLAIVGDPAPFDHVSAEPVRRDFLIAHGDGRRLRLRVRPAPDGGSVAALTELPADEAPGEGLAARAAALAEAMSGSRESRMRMRMRTASLLSLKEELYRAKRQALEADRAKHAFMRTITHELRTPLNSIIGFAEIVEQEMFGPLGSPHYKEHAALSRESGRRLLRLITRIIDVTRLEEGVAHLSFGQEPVEPLMREAAAAAAGLARERGVDLAVEAPAVLPNALADAEAVRSILDNLVDNAIAHTAPGGAITISADASDGRVRIRVADTGAGIAETDLTRVMLPFEQAGTPSAAASEGAGLGLPIVKALCEAMDGSFHLTSVLGRGTEATVSLRAAAGPVVPPANDLV